MKRACCRNDERAVVPDALGRQIARNEYKIERHNACRRRTITEAYRSVARNQFPNAAA